MQSFKVSILNIILLIILFVVLIILTIQPENLATTVRVPVLAIIDFIVLFFLIASLSKKVTIDSKNGILTVRSFMRTASVDVKNLEFAQTVNAVGRYAIILHDGNKTVTLTSVIADIGVVIDYLKTNSPEDCKEAFVSITKSSLKILKIKETLILILLIALVILGIIFTHEQIHLLNFL